MLDREVYFPLAGYAGPHAKKTFGEAFDAATGVSDPRLVRQ